MSDFICPHCKEIIDDGSDGFTSDKEIALQKKLDIAVKALKKYAHCDFEYSDIEHDELSKNYGKVVTKSSPYALDKELAQEALAKIKEVK